MFHYQLCRVVFMHCRWVRARRALVQNVAFCILSGAFVSCGDLADHNGACCSFLYPFLSLLYPKVTETAAVVPFPVEVPLSNAERWPHGSMDHECPRSPCGTEKRAAQHESRRRPGTLAGN